MTELAHVLPGEALKQKERRPTVKIWVHTTITDADLESILLGAEEEGVPVEVERRDELNPLKLAHDASEASVLGVGVGVALDYVVITTEKLPEGRPYIVRHLNAGEASDRALGASAARIVKRLPLLVK